MPEENQHPKNEAQAESPAERRVLLVAILGSAMAFLDSTVVNVSLPALQTAFHATGSQLQWIVEAYALMLAALILAGGAIGDQLGRKRSSFPASSSSPQRPHGAAPPAPSTA